MARFRKTLYLIVEGCVLVTLSVTAGVLVLHENVFRQLPLYCFLEEKAQERSAGQDRETYEKLMEEGDPSRMELLRETDVLVDGPFVIALKNLGLRFRGSSNQRILEVKASLEQGAPVLWDETSVE